MLWNVPKKKKNTFPDITLSLFLQMEEEQKNTSLVCVLFFWMAHYHVNRWRLDYLKTHLCVCVFECVCDKLCVSVYNLKCHGALWCRQQLCSALGHRTHSLLLKACSCSFIALTRYRALCGQFCAGEELQCPFQCVTIVPLAYFQSSDSATAQH